MVPELKPWLERKFTLELPDWRFPLELERLRAIPASVEDLTLRLDRTTLTTRLHDKWSIQEHVGHLLDLEALGEGRLADYAAGLPTLRAADMSNARTNLGDHNSAEIGALCRQFRQARGRFVRRLETLTAAEQQWRALHPRIKLELRPVDLMYFIAEHDNHHLARISSIIRETDSFKR